MPRSECFPIAELPTELASASEALLLAALDSEALFTIAGGLKPVSGGFATFFPNEHGVLDDAAVERTSALMAPWHCGDELAAGVYAFVHSDAQGGRYADAIVGHSAALQRLRDRHREFFAPYPSERGAPALDLVFAVERDPSPLRRWRGYGYLFGYPAYAVDFFVDAEDARARTGRRSERDFLSVPIHGGVTERFAWAVPRGHVENDDDRSIRERAQRILQHYEALRARFIGEGRPGPIALVRQLLCGDAPTCDVGEAVGAAAMP